MKKDSLENLKKLDLIMDEPCCYCGESGPCYLVVRPGDPYTGPTPAEMVKQGRLWKEVLRTIWNHYELACPVCYPRTIRLRREGEAISAPFGRVERMELVESLRKGRCHVCGRHSDHLLFDLPRKPGESMEMFRSFVRRSFSLDTLRRKLVARTRYCVDCWVLLKETVYNGQPEYDNRIATERSIDAEARDFEDSLSRRF